MGILESYFTSEALAHYVVLAQMPVLISDFFFIVHSRIDGMTQCFSGSGLCVFEGANSHGAGIVERLDCRVRWEPNAHGATYATALIDR